MCDNRLVTSDVGTSILGKSGQRQYHSKFIATGVWPLPVSTFFRIYSISRISVLKFSSYSLTYFDKKSILLVSSKQKLIILAKKLDARFK